MHIADMTLGLVIGSLVVATYFGDRFALAGRAYYAINLCVLVASAGFRVAGL